LNAVRFGFYRSTDGEYAFVKKTSGERLPFAAATQMFVLAVVSLAGRA
jgi:hypothetical protein